MLDIIDRPPPARSAACGLPDDPFDRTTPTTDSSP
jgi:hypothetical protein